MYPTIQYHHRIGRVTNTFIVFILFSWHVWKKCVIFFISNTQMTFSWLMQAIFVLFCFYKESSVPKFWNIVWLFTFNNLCLSSKSDLWAVWNTDIACPTWIKLSITLRDANECFCSRMQNKNILSSSYKKKKICNAIVVDIILTVQPIIL